MKEDNYEDIIDLPHHISVKHHRLSKEQRAAQFAPFSALTGYEDQIAETSRMTNKKIEIDEEEKSKLNYELNKIENIIQLHPLIKLIYFVKDKKKEGGEYKKIIDNVLKIDKQKKTIKLINANININDIYLIEILN